jgi:hypothetical protein
MPVHMLTSMSSSHVSLVERHQGHEVLGKVGLMDGMTQSSMNGCR